MPNGPAASRSPPPGTTRQASREVLGYLIARPDPVRGAEEATHAGTMCVPRQFMRTDMRKQPGELELFSTEELIDELMKRTTFQGVIVHAGRRQEPALVRRTGLPGPHQPEPRPRGGQPPARRRQPAHRRARAGLVAVCPSVNGSGRERPCGPAPARCNVSRFFHGRVGRCDRRAPPAGRPAQSTVRPVPRSTVSSMSMSAVRPLPITSSLRTGMSIGLFAADAMVPE